jgi:hypothetical protein
MTLFAKLVRISLNLTLARTLNRVNNSWEGLNRGREPAS